MEYSYPGFCLAVKVNRLLLLPQPCKCICDGRNYVPPIPANSCVQVLYPSDVIIFGNRVFKGAVTLLRWVLIQCDWCPYKRG